LQGCSIWENYPNFEDLQRVDIVDLAEIIDCANCGDLAGFVGPFGLVLHNPVTLPWRPMRGRVEVSKKIQRQSRPLISWQMTWSVKTL
jgi:hypothetical protein